MTKPQKLLYFREWNAAKRAAHLEDSDRHEIHLKALGYEKSSTLLTNAELDKILGHFRAISQPANLNGQLRQIEQPRTRALHRIAAQLRCLGLFIHSPQEYLATILHRRFTALEIQDLTAEIYQRPRVMNSHAGIAGKPIEDSQLDQLRNTLERVLSRKRQNFNAIIQRGIPPRDLDPDELPRASALRSLFSEITEHQMCQLAGVPCFRCNNTHASTCSDARKQKPAQAGPSCKDPVNVSRSIDPEPEPFNAAQFDADLAEADE